MAWLGTWEKRRKITIDQTQIDADLTHFPLPIALNTTAGKTDVDVSDIFTEVGANRKKIAVTKSDGTTQLYVEIEKWDNANNSALLWVSKSDWVVSGATDTDIYIYYDVSQADNTTYVGDIGGRTEVWDANFKLVHHLASAVESTAQIADATVTGATQDVGILGGYAYHFDGTNDQVVIPDDTDYTSISDALTAEVWINNQANGSYKCFLMKNAWASQKFYLYNNGSGGLQFGLAQTGGTWNGFYATAASQAWLSSPDGTTYHYVQATLNRSASRGKLYVDGGASVNDDYCNGTADWGAGAGNLNIGSGSGGQYVHAIMDEFRLSNVVRSDAYRKAVYQSGLDNVNTVGTAETLAVGSSSESSSASSSPSTSPSSSMSASPSSSPSSSMSSSTSSSPSSSPSSSMSSSPSSSASSSVSESSSASASPSSSPSSSMSSSASSSPSSSASSSASSSPSSSESASVSASSSASQSPSSSPSSSTSQSPSTSPSSSVSASSSASSSMSSSPSSSTSSSPSSSESASVSASASDSQSPSSSPSSSISSSPSSSASSSVSASSSESVSPSSSPSSSMSASESSSPSSSPSEVSSESSSPSSSPSSSMSSSPSTSPSSSPSSSPSAGVYHHLNKNEFLNIGDISIQYKKLTMSTWNDQPDSKNGLFGLNTGTGKLEIFAGNWKQV